MRFAFASLAALSAALLGVDAAAQYPAKPIRMLVAVAPGGGPDIVGRLVAGKLSDAFGQPVIVENRAGAAGNTGADAVAKAAPDGHTLLVCASNVSINATVSFVPVSFSGHQPMIEA